LLVSGQQNHPGLPVSRDVERSLATNPAGAEEIPATDYTNRTGGKGAFSEANIGTGIRRAEVLADGEGKSLRI
jgi:hypothetical protein